MILHPGILALLLGDVLVCLLLLLAGWTGVTVLRRWDPRKADDEQLTLERRTDLVSTLVNYAFGFILLSLPLLVYTLDDLHPLFVGAMCATGTLNAHPIGWSMLALKLLLFFLCGFWVVANHYDQQTESTPLVRIKYLALLVLIPLVAADFALQVVYFSGLDPQVITSCCGALFSLTGGSVAADLAALPPGPMMLVFYGAAGLFAFVLAFNLLSSGRELVVVQAIAALLFLPIALASVVSFISLYIYELPTHHCPFDLLQSGYHAVGYPLYLALFLAVLAGVVPLLLDRLERRGAGGAISQRTFVRWNIAALAGLLLFLLLSTWPVVFGRLTLRGFFQ